MADRFEEMRARGINTNDATATASDILQGKTAYVAGHKVTGVLEPSGGSSELNVFVQNNEPTNKNGVWIKKSNYSNKAYFSSSIVKQGDFANGNFSYLNKVDGIVLGQVIVGDYMYVFGASSSTSYKYNLKTKQLVGNINVPTVSFGYAGGAVYCERKGSIYVVYEASGSNGDEYCYEYDITSNTYVELGRVTGSRSSCGTLLTIYNDVLYHLHFYYVSSRSTYITRALRVDTHTNVLTTIDTSFPTNVSNYYKQGFGIGKYIYVTLDGIIYRYDCSSNTYSQKTFMTSSDETYAIYGTYPSRIVVRGGKCLLFFASQSSYLIYDWETENLTIKQCKDYTSIGGGQVVTNVVLDDIKGVVYFRRAGVDTQVLQLDELDLEEYDGDSALIVQGLDGLNLAQIDDTSKISIGIKDAYIINNSKELDGNYMVCYGDGEKWNLVKNPTGETCTVTFDLNGGTGTVSSQTITCGGKATKPSTNPTKTDETFDGWYLGDKPFDFNIALVANTTLTAHYIAYEEVDHIRSTGTQFINTGVVPTSATKLVVDYKFSRKRGQIGCGIGSDTERFVIACELEYFNLALGVGSNFSLSSDLNRHTFELDAPNKRVGIDGTYEARNYSSFSATYPIAFFCRLNASGTDFIHGGVLYSAQIYENGTLIRDFQPIQITETGEYCLLDKVNDVIYHNAGTGEFVSDNYEPTYLDYIESTGTQYIDTWVAPPTNSTLQIKCNVNIQSAQNGKSLFGNQESSNRGFVAYANNDTLYFTAGGSGSSSSTCNTSFTTGDYNINATIDTSTNTISATINNTRLTDFVYAGTVATGSTTLMNNKGQTTQQMSCKFYDAEIYIGGTKIIDLYPALDFDDTPCLWDEVNKTFYYNAGTGSFIAGGGVNNG